MTARRVQVIKEHIIQTDDTNELKCGERCQFYVQFSPVNPMCHLRDAPQPIIDRDRTEACVGGELAR